MVLSLIKMQTLNSIVGLVILIAIASSCEKLGGDTSSRFSSCQTRNNSGDLIYAFNDVGFVDIKVPGGEHYIVRGNKIFVEGSYSDPGVELRVLTEINEQANNSFTSWVNSLSADDERSFLSDLQVLSLEASHLYNLTSDSFRWLSDTNVNFLKLGHTVIKNVAEDALKPVQTNLKALDLANATISGGDLTALLKGLCNGTDGSSSTLFVLSLANLGLKSIPYEALKSVQYSLRALSFFNNDFKTVIPNISERVESVDSKESKMDFDDVQEKSANYLTSLLRETSSNQSAGSIWANFPVMPYLTELDLRQCRINSIERGTFRKLGNLKQLYISRNNILVLPNFAFEGLVNLVVLDISFNSYKPLDSEFTGMALSGHSFSDLFSLRTLILSYTVMRRSATNFLHKLPKSLVTLDLCGTELRTLHNRTFENFDNLQTLDLSHNFGLGSALTTEAFVGVDTLQKLYMVNTALRSLEAFQHLSSLKLLDVKHNNLNSLEGVLENLPLLECLDVSHNYIGSWMAGRVFAGNSRLQSVYLHSNSLSLMSEDMLEDFKLLTYLSLGNNRFICNCQLKKFMQHRVALNDNATKNLPILIDYRAEGTSYVCVDASVPKGIRFIDIDEYCVEDTTRYSLSRLQHGVYISILAVVCSLSAGGLLYWKWWYIRYVAVILKNATVMSMINVENCDNKIYSYDIFVSYSDENRNWVIEELLPNVEGPDAKFSICLHERDFQVGVSILENIITGMDQSRTILLIISGCFLRSQWCQFEMHLAQHRLLETCREELVLVLLEEIPRRKRPKILHYLMMVKTYIVWPKNSKDSNAKILFWKRLRRAITANKSKRAPSSVA